MEAHTAEDIIWMLCAVAMVGGALFIGRRFRDSLGMKILRILVYPLIMIGKILGWTLAQIVNVISDILCLLSSPLWMKFG